MTRPTLTDLAKAFRREAIVLRAWGAAGQAAAAEYAASRVDTAFRLWESELLSVSDAALESGYSETHLRRMVTESRIENQGSRGAPRIRRADLPKKPTPRRTDEVDLVGEVLQARIERGL